MLSFSNLLLGQIGHLSLSVKSISIKFKGSTIAASTFRLAAMANKESSAPIGIFDSFKDATKEGTFEVVTDYNVSSMAFNEGYRYVDWILTVPLLLVEVIAVLALAKEAARSLITRLVPASAAMIALGYPGEVSADQGEKIMWGVLSTIPFLYILYVLFVELGKSLDRQPEGVAATVGRLRLLLVATWGVYPIAYLLPIIDADGAASSGAFVGRQVGYTIADVAAKCVFGLTILKIARMKSIAEGMKDDH